MLDAFCSPSQNVLGTEYLSRIQNETDEKCVNDDFFTFNYDYLDMDGVVYGFPPRAMELSMCRHLSTFKPRRWALVMSGQNLTSAMQVLGEAYDLSYRRFAIKGNKTALRRGTPSYLLVLLLACPKTAVQKRRADNVVREPKMKSRKYFG